MKTRLTNKQIEEFSDEEIEDLINKIFEDGFEDGVNSESEENEGMRVNLK
jgi:hypothetical protein